MTLPPVTHAFVASPNPRYPHCARCGLAKANPIHWPSSTSNDEHGLTTTKDGGW